MDYINQVKMREIKSSIIAYLDLLHKTNKELLLFEISIKRFKLKFQIIWNQRMLHRCTRTVYSTGWIENKILWHWSWTFHRLMTKRFIIIMYKYHTLGCFDSLECNEKIKVSTSNGYGRQLESIIWVLEKGLWTQLKPD